MEAEDDRRLHCSRAPLMGAHESLDVGIAAGAVSTTMVVGLIGASTGGSRSFQKIEANVLASYLVSMHVTAK